MSTLDVVTLPLTNTLTTNCRVTRHMAATSNQKHGSPGETKHNSMSFMHSLFF